MQDRNINEEIKERLPIEQIIGSYIPLKKAGRTYKAICPFHGEKTPSFTVTPDRGIFKCFGCGKGGDIFDFVTEMEGLTFPEAQKLLADKAGVQLPEWKPDHARSGGQSDTISKPRLFAVNELVARLWHTILMQHPKAEHAREYLRGRGVTDDMLKTFQIGYAPYGNVTRDTLQKNGFIMKEWQAAGDPVRFQDRITFPIHDLTGKIVGFTGRLLELKDDPRGGESRGPKYWNTPETPVFIKSKAVFALHLAKHAIQKEKVAILAEGQMDVVMLHQHGFVHTVASSGTALTADQLRLIGRFADAVAFAYDGDKAGIEATKRGLELALKEELTPYVISIPNGKDPAECLQKEPSAWQEAYEHKQRGLDWLMDETLRDQPRPLPPEVKKHAAKELVRWLSFIGDPTEQADWLSRLAAKLETNEQNLRELYKRVAPDASLAAVRLETPQTVPSTAPPGSLVDTVLAIMLTFPETFSPIRPQLEILSAEPPTSLSSRILPLLQEVPEDAALDTFISARLNDDERKELALRTEELLLPYGDIELSPSWAITELSLILQRIRSNHREHAKAHISEEINRAQQLGDTERIRELFKELQNLL